ncbi:MAG: zinc ribbon domain-containing protein [Spirochaetaceae bacterium]|jgi:hypothetical protein|nr:zinc ribbon domain-containing protein [Spirochaetaceae bacterium]
MKFDIDPSTPEEVRSLVNKYTWDYPFELGSEEYFLVKERPLPGIQLENPACLILSIKELSCDIILLKDGGRMFNFLDLAAALYNRPVNEYHFWAERRLGNKYRFICGLLGGTMSEKDGRWYYAINTARAREKFFKTVLHRLRVRHMPLCRDLQNFICAKAEEAFSAIMETAKKIPSLDSSYKEHIHKKFEHYGESVKNGIANALEDRISERNEECINLMQEEDGGEKLKDHIQEVISQSAGDFLKELKDLAAGTLAYLEFSKNKSIEMNRIEKEKIDIKRQDLQKWAFKEVPFADYFMSLDKLHQFLHIEEKKREAASCRGCADWKEAEELCVLYKCNISILPFSCSHFAIKKSNTAKILKNIDVSSVIREKCGSCAYYFEKDSVCDWLKIPVNDGVAKNCSRHITAGKLFPYCPGCGKALQETWEFCGYCGEKPYKGNHYRSANEMFKYCTQCGKIMNKNDGFCGYCGTKAYAN